MALVLHLKYAENLRGKADRLSKVSFRGVSHYSKVVENAEDTAWFDELFEWPVARPIESEEMIDIQLFNYNKYLSNRLIGTFRMILQQLIDVGNLKISDSLLDANNVAMKTTLTFELSYNAPDGSVGMWQREGFEGLRTDEYRRGLTDEERNALNLERHISDTDSVPSSPSKTQSINGSKVSLSSKTSGSRRSSSKSGSRYTGLSTVVKKMKLSKQRPPPAHDDKLSLIDSGDDTADPNSLDQRAAEIGTMLAGGLKDIDDDQGSEGRGSNHSVKTGPGTSKRNRPQQKAEPVSLKAQDFQVSVTVIEARQLAGLNMDPVVCVQVGEQKKYTSVKESTNCPYYNEYFVFDFHMAPAMLFDKIITLTVCQAGRLLKTNKPLGSYKLDVAMVYSAPDHQFYHKWAVLTDPDDLNSGPKGYLKCDIAVIGKGDSIKIPAKSDKDEDDVEANLLLPAGVPADRQRANFIIKVYKAEGLPKMNSGLVANVKKAFTGESKDLVDPYVAVSFAGHRGKTSVCKSSYEPVWHEQIVFTEMFPPLCRRIKVQLRDNDSVQDDTIATHFLDLSKISNEGEKGFLPTIGPCWVNLYGSPRHFSLLDEHTHLNDGLGEGVSYRGRILLALKTEILDITDTCPSVVEVEATLPVSDIAAGRQEEFLLFGTFLEASMIDKKCSEKPIHFEISIANEGNVLDGYNPPTRRHSNSTSSDGDRSDADQSEEDQPDTGSTQEAIKWQSTTPSMKARSFDNLYFHMPYYENKPCVFVRAMFEDHRRRMYNTNIIEKIAEKLEDGITEVHEMIAQEQPYPEKRLKVVFEEFGAGCSKFVSLIKSAGSGASAGKTKLDKERHKLLLREMDQLSNQARGLKATVTKACMHEKLKLANTHLQNLRSLGVEPQHALPDIFIWMVSGNKRIAYCRQSAKDLLFSIVDEERGKNCAKPMCLFLRLPGKKASGQAGWAIQCKLQIYFWLGLTKHKKDFLAGLPRGYEETKALKTASIRPQAAPPIMITYREKQTFQLRAHMFQARSLIGSDKSGLSDPYAQICFVDQSLCTQIIEETLSPTWDEMLIMNELTVYGVMDDIKEDPPGIIVEVFDQDRVGKAEFIGRAITKPIVKMSNEKYESPNFPPRLEWWDIFRGNDKAGELLAAFELLQHPIDERDLWPAYQTPPYARKRRNVLAPFGDKHGEDLPPLEMPTVDRDRGPIMPVPKGIRPVLSKHRIEVLFWGVRDLKRVQLTSVDKPRIDIECSGHILQSAVIMNAKKNPNFLVPVKFFDVELPDNGLYCPPITIRCVDCRNFGRFVLVGTHVINMLHKFMYTPTTKSAKNAMQKLFPGHNVDGGPKFFGKSSLKADDVAVIIEGESQPLITKDHVVTIETITKDQKTEVNKRRKEKDGEDVDLTSLDWWSKYFASVETLIKGTGNVRNEEHEENRIEAAGDPLDLEHQPINAPAPAASTGTTTPYGTMPNGGNSQTDENQDGAEKSPKDNKKEKRTLKGTARAVNLAQRLSPKAQRKKKSEPVASQLKQAYHLSTVDDGKMFGRLNKMFRNDTGEIEDDSYDDWKQYAAKIRVYPNELESQPEFGGFKDWLDTFELYRGKNMGDEETDEGRIVGKFKGSLRIYKFPLPKDIEDRTVTGGDPQYGLFQGLPGNDPIKVLVRVYIIKMSREERVKPEWMNPVLAIPRPSLAKLDPRFTRIGIDQSLNSLTINFQNTIQANDLHPQDINGKADPYLMIRLGKTSVNDKDNYVSKQLNPVFGKCFEIQATFPMESLLTVQVFDWDLVGMDDLIGETKIDLENRYYSRHRATCGFSQQYEQSGYNMWRDPQKPSQILSKLCKDNKLDGPHYYMGKVRIGNHVFTREIETMDEEGGKNTMEEHLALAVLQNWSEIPQVGCALVPEHVETRPLFNPDKPGIEQGKIEMFVDMFPMDMPPPGPQVDISPRKPTSYVLRIIIWNTDDVVLEDDAFFTGEKMSDIYVKGWIKGPEDLQATDIHYRSLTGEGNFNWRFIFPFDYLVAEEKIVISRKETILSWDETETKIPPRLMLQVWDADHFSADDFLGSLTLDLTRFPRGAKSSKQCTLDMLKSDGTVPQMSLFKHKRVKGWWPFAIKAENNDDLELTGKLEAELHLLTEEEAEKHPAGLGRGEPDALDKPNRPDTSFIWFLSPLKSLRYILWRNYKWLLLKILILAAVIFLLALFFYNMPGYSVKRLWGA